MPDGNLRNKIRIRMWRWMWPPGSVSYQTHEGHSSHLAPHHNAYQPGATRNAISCSDDCWHYPAQCCRCVLILSLWREQAMCGFHKRQVCTYEHKDSLLLFSWNKMSISSSWEEIKLNVHCLFSLVLYPPNQIKKFFFKEHVAVHCLSTQCWI